MSFRRNVFILGAGFSAYAGAPLVSNFLDDARELLENPKSTLSSSEREIFREVFQYRFDLDYAKAKLKIDLDNIEELFGLLDMQCQLAADEQNPIFEIRRKLLYLIVKTLECRIGSLALSSINHWFRQDSGVETWTGYDGDIYKHFIYLTSRIHQINDEKPQGSEIYSDTVISLNYDLILEQRMQDLGIRPEYEVDHIAQGSIATHGKIGQMNPFLLKLHGSANWIACRNCPELLNVGFEKVTIFQPNLLNIDCESCGKPSLEPLIVPPTWNKGGRQPILKQVWQKALEKLSQAQRIFIIGYSVPESDRFFSYLLSAGLARNQDLYEIIIINKDPESEKKYNQIFSESFSRRYVNFQAMSFEKCIREGILQRFMQQTWKHHLMKV